VGLLRAAGRTLPDARRPGAQHVGDETRVRGIRRPCPVRAAATGTGRGPAERRPNYTSLSGSDERWNNRCTGSRGAAERRCIQWAAGYRSRMRSSVARRLAESPMQAYPDDGSSRTRWIWSAGRRGRSMRSGAPRARFWKPNASPKRAKSPPSHYLLTAASVRGAVYVRPVAIHRGYEIPPERSRSRLRGCWRRIRARLAAPAQVSSSTIAAAFSIPGRPAFGLWCDAALARVSTGRGGVPSGASRPSGLAFVINWRSGRPVGSRDGPRDRPPGGTRPVDKG